MSKWRDQERDERQWGTLKVSDKKRKAVPDRRPKCLVCAVRLCVVVLGSGGGRKEFSVGGGKAAHLRVRHGEVVGCPVATASAPPGLCLLGYMRLGPTC